MSSTNLRLVPIYTTHGDLGAILRYPYLFNPSGEWIGWVTAEREVYSIYGSFVGHISNEWRILRSRSLEAAHPTRQPPPDPGCLTPPAHFPLPPMMAELTYIQMDVLEEVPGLLPPADSGEFKPDLE